MARNSIKLQTYTRQICPKRSEDIQYNHATGVIIAHNHPAGTLKPSEDDCTITKAIKDALKTVDITLLDHIIVRDNDYYSFRNNNGV